MSRIELVKQYQMKNGDTIGNYLEKKHRMHPSEWVERDQFVEFITKVSHLTKIYRWEFVGNKFYSVNGGSVSITPELHRNQIIIDNVRRSIPSDKLEIYDFVYTHYNQDEELMSDVLRKAKDKFGLVENEIESIYLAIEDQITKCLLDNN